MNGFNFSDATDIKLGSSSIAALYYGFTLLWPLETDYSKEYLTIEETVDSSTVFFTTTDTITTKSIQYSKDQINWTSINFNTNENAPSVNITKGEKLYLKAINDTYYSTNGFFSISIQGYSVNSKTKIYGNIMSLLYGDNFYGQTTLNSNNNGAFESLFFPWNIVLSSLYDASDLILPATTLSERCYEHMFSSSGLVIPPKLPATTLAASCYRQMFSSCRLTSGPELPATTLAASCYNQMFDGCTSLTTAPELPATTLAAGCYNSMFSSCYALTTAPELPATTLASTCYFYMFYNCTSLNYIKCLATDISASNCLFGWTINVASTGTFVKNTNMSSWPTGDSGIPSGWTVQNYGPHDYSQDYLTFEALEAGTFTWTDTQNSNSISYSTDNGSTWSTLASGSSTPTIAANSKVLFKASGLSAGTNGIGRFSSTGTFNAMGNIMSLVYGDNFANQTTISDYQFYKLFKGAGIIDASNLILPATTLAQSCYREMFDSSELEITPKSLPATTLAEGCCRSMFGNCASLITVMSILPAMTLAPDCYRYMFASTSLTIAPELPATTLANNCYYNMFGGCKSLTTAPELPATTLSASCYYQMFNSCTALSTAPELPATTLANNCYYQMFKGCTNLTTAPELPATTLSASCYYWMFDGCSSLTTAPELPATTLVQNCYNNMFRSCTSLNYIKCLATNISATSCTTNWVYKVASTGIFVKNPNMSSWPTGTSGIPSGWTVQNAS